MGFKEGDEVVAIVLRSPLLGSAQNRRQGGNSYRLEGRERLREKGSDSASALKTIRNCKGIWIPTD